MNRILFIFSLLVGVVSCDIADEYTVNTSQRLRFSNDTLNFDTLFATVPSTTRTLVLFNDDEKGMRVSSVRLEGGVDSPYRVNVDGEVLDGLLADLKIAGGDSVFVFAELTLPETSNNTYMSHDDALVFTLENGVVQRVPLLSTALGAEIYDAPVILARDTVFAADRVRVFRRSLVVSKDVTLQIEPGATLYFHTGSGLDVYGTLLCNGDTAACVTLRGDRLDRLFPYLPYDNTVGRWEGVTLHSSSHGNEIRFTDIHSGMYGIKADTTDVLIDASVIHNVDGDALRLLSSKALVSNTQLSNAHGNCAAVYGGDVRFVFVTMAQFYPWRADRGAALFLADRLLDIDAPATSMHFSSCLVTGYGDDVLMGDFYDVASAPYMFSHCVLRTPAVDDELHYKDILWELAKNDKDEEHLQGTHHFRLFDTDNFLYDFAPVDSSIVRGVADAADVVAYPRDMRSVLRADSVSAGCYEFVRESVSDGTKD